MHFRSLSLLALLLGFATASKADHPTLSLEDGRPGPVTTLSAVTMPKGTASAAVQSQFVFTDEISDADLIRYTLLNDHVHSTASLASLSLNSAYGFTDDFTAGFALPYLWRSSFRSVGFRMPTGVATEELVRTPRHAGHGGHGGNPGPVDPVPYVESTDFEGLGDATFYGQYRFFHDEAALRHAALLVGLKTPTGRTDVRNAQGVPIEGDHQPGSGSWDPILGFSFTQQAGRWSFDVGGLYSFVNEGVQRTDRGDIVNYNAAISYRVLGAESHDDCDHHGHGHSHGPTPKEVAAPHHHDHAHGGPTWDLILEANGDWRDQVRIGGIAEENTGGNVVFLSLGSRVTLPSGWATSASVGLPVVSDFNGIQSEPELRVLFGVSRAF